MANPMSLRGRCFSEIVHPGGAPREQLNWFVHQLIAELFIAIAVGGGKILHLGAKSEASSSIVMGEHPFGEDAPVIALRAKITGIQKNWFFRPDDYYLVCAMVVFCVENGFSVPVSQGTEACKIAFRRNHEATATVISQFDERWESIIFHDLPEIAAMVAIRDKVLADDCHNIDKQSVVREVAACLKEVLAS